MSTPMSEPADTDTTTVVRVPCVPANVDWDGQSLRGTADELYVPLVVVVWPTLETAVTYE